MKYVEFHGGYIAPCEVIKEIPGHVKVLLRPAPPYERHSWAQWVRQSQILDESEVEPG